MMGPTLARKACGDSISQRFSRLWDCYGQQPHDTKRAVGDGQALVVGSRQVYGSCAINTSRPSLLIRGLTRLPTSQLSSVL
jgi:hypothetical protein